MIVSESSSTLSPFSSALPRWWPSCSVRYSVARTLTVIRFRSRGESSGRYDTSPNRTPPVTSTGFGAISMRLLGGGLLRHGTTPYFIKVLEPGTPLAVGERPAPAARRA